MRPVTRTRTLSRDEINRIKALFGTVTNAHRMLGLGGLVDYPIFYRSMQFETVTPSQHEEIVSAWERWQYLFLRPNLPETETLALTPMNRVTLPDWHPDAKPVAATKTGRFKAGKA